MDLSGKIKDVYIDFQSRKPNILLEVNEEPNGIDDLLQKDLSIKLNIKRKSRSLDANAYFHVLVDKLRQKLGISFANCKNLLICSYGQIMYLDDGCPLVYKTNAPPEYIQELEEPHLQFLKQSEDGAYWYKMYRGSHTYDTSEMSKLIEGTVEECKAQNIEVLSADQLKELEIQWGIKYERESEKRKGIKEQGC